MDLPSGTVALLFTDIESSMALWTADAEAMAASLEAHDRIMLEHIESAGGYVFTRAGDSFSAAFASVRDAVAVAQRCQQRLDRTDWPGPELRVRMGVHVGDVQVRDGDYFGPAVNLAARVADTGHGGQVVVTTDALAASGSVGPTVSLGAFRLKGSTDRVELHQLGAGAFPPLRADEEPSASLRFDEFELDLAARQLRADGQAVPVEPQVLDVLIHLVLHRDRLVSREELLDEVWGDQFVSASALTTRIKQARQALGDDGRTQRYIRNERGRGYQFEGQVTSSAPPEPAPAATPRITTPVVTGPTIFGRLDDLDEVEQLMHGAALTTLVGPGGVGKTTLVAALAARWSGLGQAALEVQLDTVRDEAGILPALTTSLGLSPDDEPVVACAEWLAATDQVLVLDNCEHLLDPVRDLVAELLAASPSIRVLATSRQPLGLAAERVHRLQPLDVPEHDAVDDPSLWPCLELFAEAARRAGGMHILTDDDWAEVVRLCRGLDGLPLAIELAASRLSTFGIRDLIAGLDDRLDWFRSRDVDAGERQRSLRSTVAWSFQYLDDDALALVAALARFPAGLCLPDLRLLAAELESDIATDELVARLVDASVLVCTRAGGEARYSMLETIRQYGLERLDQEPDLRELADRRLIAHCLGVARAERDAWTGEVDPTTRSLQRLRDEVPNLRAGRALMLERDDPVAAVELAVGLCAFTEEATLAELWSWHDTSRLGDLDAHEPEVAAGALLLEATVARNRGDIERCAEAAAAAAERSADRWIRGRGKHTGAMAALFSGDPFQAIDLWLESDAELGGCRGRLFAAMASAFAGDLDQATSHLSQCRIEPDSAVPVDLFTNVHLVRGEVARVADTGDARHEFEQAVAVAREHGLLFSLGIAQVPLVAIAEADGDHATAAAGYREMVGLFLRSGTWTQVWTTLRNAARLIVAEAPATALLVVAAADRDPGSPALDDEARAEADELERLATEAIGPEEADRVRRRAAIVARADVVRETVDVLRSYAA